MTWTNTFSSGAKCDVGVRQARLNPASDSHCQQSHDDAERDPRILVIAGDYGLTEYIASNLKEKRLSIAVAANGLDGLKLVTTDRFDVLIVDQLLPDMDGISLLATLRNADSETPCLFLTRLDGINSRTEKLTRGVDDFLVKPFDFVELCARVHILAKRARARAQQTTLRFADLEMNLLSRRVTRSGRLIHLPPRQFELLELLMRNCGRVLSRRQLMKLLSASSLDRRGSSIQANISRLRAKIDESHEASLIRTIRGIGYSLYALK